MLCLSLALSLGDVSVVQPIMGLIPLLTMAGGAFFLHELPSPIAVVGIVLVVTGLYFVGLRRGGSAWEPHPRVRDVARELVRTACRVVLDGDLVDAQGRDRRGGSDAVGDHAHAGVRPRARRRAAVRRALGGAGSGSRSREEVMPWLRVVALTSVCFAVQQFGLHNALRRSQAGYVMAVVSTSILIATTVGVLVLRERGGSHRITGALLVSGGVALIAIFG